MTLTLLDNVNLAVQGVSAACREWRRWRIAPQRDAVRVFYGSDHILGAKGEPTYGGLVKILDLLPYFPNTPRGANILYLVSSSRPVGALNMAQCAKRAGAKVVINQNGVGYPGWHGPGWERFNAPLSELLGLADHVLYQSKFCKISADRYLGMAKCGWEVLQNPVDTSVFVPPAHRISLAKEVVLLLAGSHGQLYRIRTALQTLAYVRAAGLPARLIIAGRFYWQRNHAACVNDMLSLARELGAEGQVQWVGAYTQAEAVRLFQGAHVLVHPVYNDACPRLVVEAMACGVPVVYSASGGTPELVGSEAGEGVSAPLDWEQMHPPSAEELSAAVLKVCERWEEFSRNAYQRAVTCWDVKPWVERHRKVFEELMQ